MSYQCKKCGSEVPEDALFCSKCGEKIKGTSLPGLRETAAGGFRVLYLLRGKNRN